jgi:hypothetical protein
MKPSIIQAIVDPRILGRELKRIIQRICFNSILTKEMIRIIPEIM